MLGTYFKIAFRHLLKNRFFTFLNLAGLTAGMAVAFIIGLWVWDEASYNSYHDNHERIVAVMQNNTFDGNVETWWSQPKQTVGALRDNYGSHFEHLSMLSSMRTGTLKKGDKILDRQGMYAEASAPEMLSLKMLHGTRVGLDDPNKLLLSASTAKAIFGTENVVGESLTLNEESVVTISGVFEDLPENTSYAEMEYMGSWKLFEQGLPDWLSWGNSWFNVIGQLKAGEELATVSHLIKDLKYNSISEEEGKRFKPEIFLHPMTNWRLYSKFENGQIAGGRITSVRSFAIIGLIVLFLACINFMNLSTARSEQRSREVGIRKTMGSKRSQLMAQFYSESLLLAFLGGSLALLVTNFSLPFFNEIAEKTMELPLASPAFWGVFAALCILTGVLAGSYPALYLSSFKPTSAIKGGRSSGSNKNRPRQMLVVTQFTVSVVLIVATIVVLEQIQYAKDRPIGFNQNGLIGLTLRGAEINDGFDVFREDLLRTGVVEEVAKSANAITRNFTTNSGLDWEGKPEGFQDEFVTMRVSHEFGKTIGWEINEGRDFSREFATDTFGFVINETAVDYFGFEDPIGKQVNWGDDEVYTIIGVVNDLLTQSPYTPVRQSIFFIDYDRSNYATIKMKATAGTSEAIAAIEGVFRKHDPINNFDYEFIDELHAQKFAEEERIGKLSVFFAALAIFISCLGLLGMAVFVAERRSKEIGIRKVLGATVSSIVNLISSEFLKLVLIALIIAWPLAYWLMNGWLNDFSYSISLAWWHFGLAGGLAFLIAFLTVGTQSLRAALNNPIHALKNE